MNNTAIGVLVGVGVLGTTAVGASAYTGRVVTGRLSEQTAQLGRLLPELRLQEKTEPGLFRTSRELKLQLGCLPVPSKDGASVERTAPIEVYWRDTIHHVPFVSARGQVASIDSELVIASANVEQLLGTRAPLTLHTNIALDQRFEGDAKLVSFKVAPKPGDELEFSGLVMHVTGSFPDSAGTLSYAGQSEPLQLRGKADDGSFSANVGPMQLTGSVQLDPAASSFIMPYHSEMRVGELTAQVVGPTAPTAFNIAMRAVTAKVDTTIANDLMASTTHMQGSLKADDFAIDKVELGGALRNLHVPTLTKLMRAWMSQSMSCEAAPESPEALMEQLAELGKGALELLPHAPEYKVGPMAIELGGKRAELSYTLGVHGVAPGSSPELMELATKYGYASAEAKLDLGLVDQLATYASKLSASSARAGQQQRVVLQQGGPDPAALMARGMLESFVQEGYIERTGETVHGRIDFDAGTFKLNGREIELPDFGGMDLDAVKRSMTGEPDNEAAAPPGDEL